MSVSGTITATDIDGDTLSYAVKTGAGPANGSVALDSRTGAWTYVPNANVNGTDSFIVVVSDGKGGSSESTVSVTIKPVNDAPVTVADPEPLPRTRPPPSTSLPTIPIRRRPADACRLRGDGGTGLALTNAEAATAFSIVDGKLVADPSSAFQALEDEQNAMVTVTYTVRDAQGGESTGTASIKVDGYTEYNVVEGTDGNDTLVATDRKDMIEAGNGNDTVLAGDGNDMVDAGAGNDRVVTETATMWSRVVLATTCLWAALAMTR